MYKDFLRPLLFALDSEQIHDLTYKSIRFSQLSKIPAVLKAFCLVEDPRLHVDIAGITFKNPLGLAAGFDKEAVGYELLSALGFGSIEVGTITSEAQAGNPKPRIFRLPADEALINRMGFPSSGIDAVLPNLRRNAALSKQAGAAVLGINIGKAKSVPLEDAATNYRSLLKQVKPFAKYIAVNISSPNTPELRKLQEPARLIELFTALNEEAARSIPLFVKLAPDIDDADLRSIVEVCKSVGVSALIATNTTIGREGLTTATSEAGGMSGQPLKAKSLGVVKRLSELSEKQIPIIGVGGIKDDQDVLDFLKAGASTVQIYTSLIYEGPFVVNVILKKLVARMNTAGVNSLTQLTS